MKIKLTGEGWKHAGLSTQHGDPRFGDVIRNAAFEDEEERITLTFHANGGTWFAWTEAAPTPGGGDPRFDYSVTILEE